MTSPSPGALSRRDATPVVPWAPPFSTSFLSKLRDRHTLGGGQVNFHSHNSATNKKAEKLFLNQNFSFFLHFIIHINMHTAQPSRIVTQTNGGIKKNQLLQTVYSQSCYYSNTKIKKNHNDQMSKESLLQQRMFDTATINRCSSSSW